MSPMISEPPKPSQQDQHRAAGSRGKENPDCSTGQHLAARLSRGRIARCRSAPCRLHRIASFLALPVPNDQLSSRFATCGFRQRHTFVNTSQRAPVHLRWRRTSPRRASVRAGQWNRCWCLDRGRARVRGGGDQRTWTWTWTSCVPKTSSTSCDQAIFVDRATDARVSSDLWDLNTRSGW
jgi:hypothetical protein